MFLKLKKRYAYFYSFSHALALQVVSGRSVILKHWRDTLYPPYVVPHRSHHGSHHVNHLCAGKECLLMRFLFRSSVLSWTFHGRQHDLLDSGTKSDQTPWRVNSLRASWDLSTPALTSSFHLSAISTPTKTRVWEHQAWLRDLLPTIHCVHFLNEIPPMESLHLNGDKLDATLGLSPMPAFSARKASDGETQPTSLPSFGPPDLWLLFREEEAAVLNSTRNWRHFCS